MIQGEADLRAEPAASGLKNRRRRRNAKRFGAKRQKQKTGHPAAHALARYRCFLPDLAGLAGLRRAGPGVSNSNIFASAWVS